MPENESDTLEMTYSLGAAARLTGLSPGLLRAWERRYSVVEPLRTPGGTRRYRASDLERLRQVKAAVDAGHRIGQVAGLDIAALNDLSSSGEESDAAPIADVLDAIERLDGAAVHRSLSLQLSALGPIRFAREFALPLVYEIGDRWADERLGVASEHLATSVLRSMLGSALLPSAASLHGPTVVFATPSGERHELGLQMAALVSLGAGANSLYLGPELPLDDLLDAAQRCRAAAVALSIVSLASDAATRAVRAVRGGLPANVRLWIGGAGAGRIEIPTRVEHIATFEALELRVQRLDFENTPR